MPVPPLIRVACVAVAASLVPLIAPSPVAAAVVCQPPTTRRLTQRPWAQNRLQFERAWPITKGAGQLIAVVDTGVDAKHPQLRGHVEPGYDVLTGHADGNYDCQGHGTFVAGIIAAQPVDGSGFAGVAPDATILPIRETTSDQVGVQALAKAVEAATRSRPAPSVINISATTNVDYPELRTAIQAALAANIVVVAAAGNEAQQGDAAKYPAIYPGVLSVGAIDPAGNRAQFSETVGVDLVAPGQDLISTGAGGDGLVTNQGTSFAAPYVAGVVALVRAYHPLLSAAQVVRRIELTADHPAGTLPHAEYGWGVVNPYAAVTAILPAEGQLPLARSTRSPVPLAAATKPPDHRAATLAYRLAALAVAVAGLAYVVAVLVPMGRRRGWRPALRSGPPQPP